MIGPGVASPYTSKVFTCRALGCGASEPGRPHEPPGWGYSIDGGQRCPVHAESERKARRTELEEKAKARYAELLREPPRRAS